MNLTADKFIEHHSSFTTEEFAEAIRNEVPDIGRSTIYSILKKKCDSGKISRTGRGRFSRSSGKEYFYELSETAKNIVALIQASYPLVDFQIWELYQMNEFVNHLLAKNTIFVEVENMLDESVFNLLFDRYPHVLHNPDIEEYYKYAGDECNSEENLKWLNSLGDGGDYTQCIEFLTDFHSPVLEEQLEGTAWEPDHEYADYQWWLARKDGGDWELVSWGY